MSLKGYEWLNDDGKVIMSFTFKRLDLDIWEDVSQKDYDDFVEYIKSNGFNIHHQDNHYHKVGE